jgi:hypothetical protein
MDLSGPGIDIKLKKEKVTEKKKNGRFKAVN